MNCNLLATYKHFYFLKKKINIDFKLQIFLLFVVKLIILLYTGVHLICGIIQVFRIFFTFDHSNRFWVLFLHFRKSSLYRNVKNKTQNLLLWSNVEKIRKIWILPHISRNCSQIRTKTCHTMWCLQSIMQKSISLLNSILINTFFIGIAFSLGQPQYAFNFSNLSLILCLQYF